MNSTYTWVIVLLKATHSYKFYLDINLILTCVFRKLLLSHGDVAPCSKTGRSMRSWWSAWIGIGDDRDDDEIARTVEMVMGGSWRGSKKDSEGGRVVLKEGANRLMEKAGSLNKDFIIGYSYQGIQCRVDKMSSVLAGQNFKIFASLIIL